MLKRIIILAILLTLFPFKLGDYYNAEKVVQHAVIAKQKKLTINFKKQVSCLAKNIYYEAGYESYEGKLAVATVTLNRVKHRDFPDTVCDVVYQRNKRGCQFSWTCGPKAPFELSRYRQTEKLAEKILTRNLRVARLKKALYFHNTSITPDWNFAQPVTQIGNHIFYEPRRNTSTS